MIWIGKSGLISKNSVLAGYDNKFDKLLFLGGL